MRLRSLALSELERKRREAVSRRKARKTLSPLTSPFTLTLGGGSSLSVSTSRRKRGRRKKKRKSKSKKRTTSYGSPFTLTI